MQKYSSGMTFSLFYHHHDTRLSRLKDTLSSSFGDIDKVLGNCTVFNCDSPYVKGIPQMTLEPPDADLFSRRK